MVDMISDVIGKSDYGVVVSGKVVGVLIDIFEKVCRMDDLVCDIVLGLKE